MKGCYIMNRLKELRQEKKLSQKELAKTIGVHYRTLQNWENGESQIKPDKAKKLADFFGVDVGYLLGYNNDLRFRNEIIHDIDDTSKKYGDYLPALNKRLSEEGFNIDKFDEETSKLIGSINEKLIKIGFVDLLRVYGYIDSILEEYDSN